MGYNCTQLVHSPPTEDEARGGAGEREERVHRLAAAQARGGHLEELLLLARVARRAVGGVAYHSRAVTRD